MLLIPRKLVTTQHRKISTEIQAYVGLCWRDIIDFGYYGFN